MPDVNEDLTRLKLISSLVSASIILLLVVYAFCCRKKCSKRYLVNGDAVERPVYKVKDFVVLAIISLLECAFFIEEMVTADSNIETDYQEAWIWAIIVVEMELVIYWFLHQSEKWTLAQLILAILSISFSILYTWILLLLLTFHSSRIGAIYFLITVIFTTQTLIALSLFTINIYKRCFAPHFSVTNSLCLDLSMNCVLLIICTLSIGVLAFLSQMKVNKNSNQLTIELRYFDNIGLDVVFHIFFLTYRFLIFICCGLMFLMIHSRAQSTSSILLASMDADEKSLALVTEHMGHYYSSIKWTKLSVAVVGVQDAGKSVLIRELTGMSDKSETELHMIDIYRKWDPKTRTNFKFWDTIGDRRFIWHSLDCMARSDVIVIVIGLLQESINPHSNDDNELDPVKQHFDGSLEFVKNMNDEIRQAYIADGYRFESELKEQNRDTRTLSVGSDSSAGTPMGDLQALPRSPETQRIADYEMERLSNGPMFKKFPAIVVSLHACEQFSEGELGVACLSARSSRKRAMDELRETCDIFDFDCVDSTDPRVKQSIEKAIASSINNKHASVGPVEMALNDDFPLPPSRARSESTARRKDDLSLCFYVDFAQTFGSDRLVSLYDFARKNKIGKHIYQRSDDFDLSGAFGSRQNSNTFGRTPTKFLAQIMSELGTQSQPMQGIEENQVSEMQQEDLQKAAANQTSVNEIDDPAGYSVKYLDRTASEEFAETNGVNNDNNHKITNNANGVDAAAQTAQMAEMGQLGQLELQPQELQKIASDGQDASETTKKNNIKTWMKERGAFHKILYDLVIKHWPLQCAQSIVVLLALPKDEFDKMCKEVLKDASRRKDIKNDRKLQKKFFRAYKDFRSEWKKVNSVAPNYLLNMIHHSHKNYQIKMTSSEDDDHSLRTRCCNKLVICFEYLYDLWADFLSHFDTHTRARFPLPRKCIRQKRVFIIRNESEFDIGSKSKNKQLQKKKNKIKHIVQLSSSGPEKNENNENNQNSGAETSIITFALEPNQDESKERDTVGNNQSLVERMKDFEQQLQGSINSEESTQLRQIVQNLETKNKKSVSNSILTLEGLEKIMHDISVNGPMGSAYFWSLHRPVRDIIVRFITFYLFGMLLPLWAVIQTCVFWFYSEEWGLGSNNRNVLALMKRESIDRFGTFFLDCFYAMFPRDIVDPRQERVLGAGIRSFVNSSGAAREVNLDAFFRQTMAYKVARVAITFSMLMLVTLIGYNLRYFIVWSEKETNQVSKIEMLGGVAGFLVIWTLVTGWFAHSVRTCPDFDALFTKDALQSMKIVYKVMDKHHNLKRVTSNLDLFLQSYQYYQAALPTFGHMQPRTYAYGLCALLFAMVPGMTRVSAGERFFGDWNDGPQRNCVVRSIIINFVLTFVWLYMFEKNLYQYFRQYSDLMTLITELIEINTKKQHFNKFLQRLKKQLLHNSRMRNMSHADATLANTTLRYLKQHNIQNISHASMPSMHLDDQEGGFEAMAPTHSMVSLPSMPGILHNSQDTKRMHDEYLRQRRTRIRTRNMPRNGRNGGNTSCCGKWCGSKHSDTQKMLLKQHARNSGLFGFFNHSAYLTHTNLADTMDLIMQSPKQTATVSNMSDSGADKSDAESASQAAAAAEAKGEHILHLLDEFDYDKFQFLSFDFPQNLLSWRELRAYAFVRGKQLFAELELFIGISCVCLIMTALYIVWKAYFQRDTSGQTIVGMFLIFTIVGAMVIKVLLLGIKFDRLQRRQVRALMNQVSCVKTQAFSQKQDTGPTGWHKFQIGTWIRESDMNAEDYRIWKDLYDHYMGILDTAVQQIQEQSINPTFFGFNLNGALVVTLVGTFIGASLSALYKFI